MAVLAVAVAVAELRAWDCEAALENAHLPGKLEGARLHLQQVVEEIAVAHAPASTS